MEPTRVKAVVVAVLLTAVLPAGCGKKPPLPADQRAQNAKRAAESVAAATIARNYGLVADLTYPPVVTGMGGRDKMIDRMKEADAADPSYTLTSFTFGEFSQMVQDGDRFYAVLPARMNIKCREGTLQTDTQTLGISDDGGRTWTFVSVADPDDVRRAIPTLPADLKLVKQPPPKLIRSN